MIDEPSKAEVARVLAKVREAERMMMTPDKFYSAVNLALEGSDYEARITIDDGMYPGVYVINGEGLYDTHMANLEALTIDAEVIHDD